MINSKVLTGESSCSSEGEFATDSGDSGEDTTIQTHEGLIQLIRKLLSILQATTNQLEAMYMFLAPIKKTSELLKKMAAVLHINSEVLTCTSDGEFTTTETNAGLERLTRTLLTTVQNTTKQLELATDDLKKKQHC